MQNNHEARKTLTISQGSVFYRYEKSMICEGLKIDRPYKKCIQYKPVEDAVCVCIFPVSCRTFWTAKQKPITTTNRTLCLLTPYVWVKNSSTSSSTLPSQSWESSMWCSGEPSCHLHPEFNNVAEACMQIYNFTPYCANDIACGSPSCPVCQVD